MTRSDRQLLALGAVFAAAALVMASGGLLRVHAGADEATGAWVPTQDYGPGCSHLAHPSDFAAGGTPMLGGRHALFRRPAQIGGARARVSADGWAWFTNPPSEQGL